jgi:carboxymethylenebutenolidase
MVKEGYLSISGKDGVFQGYFVPAPEPSAPSLVALQEMYGVNAFMQHVCRFFAAAGFSTLCPDLYWRQRPGVSLTDGSKEELDQAFALFNSFDVDKGAEDIQTTIDHLRSMKSCSGRVGGVGYCLGGLLAYITICRTNADCAVGYYGVDYENRLAEAAKMQHPLMLHIADEDSTMTPEAIRAQKDGLAGHPQVTIHAYPNQDHAFARVGTRYFKYDEAAANLANRRTIEFLKRHLL